MHNNDRYSNHESGDGYHKNSAGMEAMAEVLGLTIEELEDAMNEYMHSSGGMYFENSEFLEERAAALGITVEELVANIDEVRDEYMGGCGNHTGGHRSMHN